MTYDIKSVDQLENSAADLATYNQNVTNNASSLQHILGEIQTNWQNEAGTDLATVIEELQGCISKLNNAIIPTVGKYVSTMNTLVAESRTTQSKSMN